MPELVLIGSRAAARYCPEVAAGLGPQTDVDLIASPAKAAELRALEGVCGLWDHGGGCVGFNLRRPGCWSTSDHIDLEEAAPGTIRADFAQTVDENAVHGSDAPETAKAEIAFFFPDGICERTR